ncbi:MAG: hypothetical protein J3Q66DRAFT_439550 [Benniella sp.]|nr:MAG: hypothetical protein J3Q66DRAFT_439550 [Benniella sp.]
MVNALQEPTQEQQKQKQQADFNALPIELTEEEEIKLAKEGLKDLLDKIPIHTVRTVVQRKYHKPSQNRDQGDSIENHKPAASAAAGKAGTAVGGCESLQARQIVSTLQSKGILNGLTFLPKSPLFMSILHAMQTVCGYVNVLSNLGIAQTILITAAPLIPNIGNTGSTGSAGGGAGAGAGTGAGTGTGGGGGGVPDGALLGGIGAIAHLIPGVGAVSKLLPLIPVIGGLLGGGGLVNTPAVDVHQTTAPTTTTAVTTLTDIAATTYTANSAAGSKTLAPTASPTPKKQNGGGGILGWPLVHWIRDAGEICQ